MVLDRLTMENPPVRRRTSPWAENFTRLKTIGDPDGLKGRAETVTEMLGGVT